MANLAQSAVVIEDIWSEGNTNGRKFKCVRAVLTLTGQGGATNLIPAALFGISRIIEVASATKSDGTNLVAGPDYLGANLSFYTAVHGSPTDETATARVVVKGI